MKEFCALCRSEVKVPERDMVEGRILHAHCSDSFIKDQMFNGKRQFVWDVKSKAFVEVQIREIKIVCV